MLSSLQEKTKKTFDTIIFAYPITKNLYKQYKKWEDNDNQDGIRPQEITITLGAYESPAQRAIVNEVETIKLNSENDWKHIFENLPKYSNGNELKYQIPTHIELSDGQTISLEDFIEKFNDSQLFINVLQTFHLDLNILQLSLHSN